MQKLRKLAALWAAAMVLGTCLLVQTAPVSGAAVCGSVGGARFDVTGCADPFSEIGYPPPPPPPAPNVTVCADVGRRISVSGCI